MMSGARRVVNWADPLKREDRHLYDQLYEQSGEAEGDLDVRGGVEQGQMPRGPGIMPSTDAGSSPDEAAPEDMLALVPHSKGCYDGPFIPEYTPHPPVHKRRESRCVGGINSRTVVGQLPVNDGG